MNRIILSTLLFVSSAIIALAQGLHSPASTAVPYEVRAVWLTTLSGLDWPSRPATDAVSTERQQQELIKQLDQLQAAGINTVLFQTRIRATTAYPSAIEPFDGIFTGTPGKCPTYDPLDFAIRACHERGMECHAWVVAFPVGKVAAMKALGKRALPAQHPALVQRCGDQWMMDPGVPGTDDYLASICQEIVDHYDVDGIHLDYIRYPEKGIPFNDDATYRRYGGNMDRATWRTNNVNRCVQKISETVKRIRPWIKMSCSPVGKFDDLSRYASKGWNARRAVHQDAQRWLKEGWMDWLFPMMYFDGNHFYPFLADWKENDMGRIVAPGLGIYFLNPREKNWPLEAVRRQLNVIRSEGLGGAAYFRAAFLLNNEKGLYDWLQQDYYRQPALTPPMTWADHSVPEAPQVKQRIDHQLLQLSWNAVSHDSPITYNVYRLDSIHGDLLLAHRLQSTAYERLLYLPALRNSRYVVTAVDAFGNESQPGADAHPSLH